MGFLLRPALASLAALLLLTISACPAAPLAGFKPTGFRDEQQREWMTAAGVRIVVNAAGDFDLSRPTLLVLYALPNGNTIEWTLGAQLRPGMDWHYDIQHVAAQVRKLRQVDKDENVGLALLEAQGKSWPAWRKARPDNGALIRSLVDQVSRAVPGPVHRIALTAHSGGGSFIFGYLNGGDAIGPTIQRIAWIDATYAYDDANDHHGDKLLAWLKGDRQRELVVIAYDDRDVTLNGKRIVSPTGGTYYRSHRMIDRLSRDVTLDESRRGEFESFVGMNGQVHFLIHTNPEKKILHTVLVERNGLLEALTLGTPLEDKWGGTFWGERAYADLIAPAPVPATGAAVTQPARGAAATSAPATRQAAAIPARPPGAPGGKTFAETIADLPPKARESAIVQEITRGNVPDFERTFRPIRATDGKHQIVYEVMPDYLAVGSDEDFVRMPVTPASAQQIADAFQCTLPTRKMVNDVYAQAEVKLEPRPLTEQREAVRTFVRHNDIIEQQRQGKPLGLLVAGHKKDVVLTNRLKEKPNKVAIYGWHKLDGKPIQPLYVGHADFYADYSHGIRLVKRACAVDGKPTTIKRVLKDPELCGLLSDEGPVDVRYEHVGP